jgi:hypothetical protein
MPNRTGFPNWYSSGDRQPSTARSTADRPGSLWPWRVCSPVNRCFFVATVRTRMQRRRWQVGDIWQIKASATPGAEMWTTSCSRHRGNVAQKCLALTVGCNTLWVGRMYATPNGEHRHSRGYVRMTKHQLSAVASASATLSRRTCDPTRCPRKPCLCFWKRHSATLPLIFWSTMRPSAARSKSVRAPPAHQILFPLSLRLHASFRCLSTHAEHKTDTDRLSHAASSSYAN